MRGDAGAISDAKIKWLSAVLGIAISRPSDPVSSKSNEDDASGGAPGNAPGAPQLIAIPDSMSPSGMNDEDIAAAIMDKQDAILRGWQTALLVFDKVMNSSSDAEATPEFQKVVLGHFSEKVMGALLQHAPGAAELDALVQGLSAEAARAAAASASATLRDFVVQHAQAIGRVMQALLSQRQGFISAVHARRDAYEALSKARQIPKGAKAHKGVVIASSKADDDYALMRMSLLDTLEAVDAVLGRSSSQALFRVLSEEWVRSGKVAVGLGVHVAATIIIRLNQRYGIIDAHIQGPGGQKLAEQLLKDAPEGVDVFSLRAPRRILLMAENGWPEITLSLDANNRDISSGTFGEGDTNKLRRYVLSKGLPTTKKLSGD